MRSYSRFKTDLDVQCRLDGSDHAVGLYNLSCGGCMIEAPDVPARTGDAVTIALNARIVVPGRIVWRVEKNVGVKFDIPVHQKVVEHFGYRNEQFDGDDPRDRFGIPLIEIRETASGILEQEGVAS